MNNLHDENALQCKPFVYNNSRGNYMTTPVQVRIDTEVKENVIPLFKSLGLDMSSAINIFLRHCLIKGGLPFEVYNPKYNKETIKAMRESEKLGYSKKVKRYSSAEDLFKSLDK